MLTLKLLFNRIRYWRQRQYLKQQQRLSVTRFDALFTSKVSVAELQAEPTNQLANQAAIALFKSISN